MPAHDLVNQLVTLLEESSHGPMRLLGISVACYFIISFVIFPLLKLLLDSTPQIHVEIDPDEQATVLEKPVYKGSAHDLPGQISCVDPGTGQLLGHVPMYTPKMVHNSIALAKAAQVTWQDSTFSQRRKLLRVFNRYILENAETICKVAARDSGKAMVDAAFGELMVTCEKIAWLLKDGERHLRPEARAPGAMMFYKSCRVEYVPVGVVGTIVPWNYPFHNVFNPLTAAVFAGNAVIIKVSEHASWSVRYYQRIIDAALEAAGAPRGLVQIITGEVETGRALVTGGCDKLIFIGSTTVGRHVMRDAAECLTPVTLELGGKDPFIVCDDADLKPTIATAMRAAFQSCGQNCVAAERFIVHDKVYDEFVNTCAALTSSLRQGPPLGGDMVDCGAMCLPGLAEKVHELVEDARSKGARVMAGGCLPSSSPGQFYPPTLVADVTPEMRLWREETFGPVMAVTRFTSDDEAVRLANDCTFGLGSSAFSNSQARANRIGSRIKAGMFAVNDFATYSMCQSLPFGGVRESGFDRFGGVEGLRGVCIPKVVVQDRFPFLMKTAIPPPLQYPVASCGFQFVHALCKMFYGCGIGMRIHGLLTLATCFLAPKQLRPVHRS